MWAIDALNGARTWSVGAGRILTSPVVRNDRLYVANVSGEVKALNKLDGSTVWSIHRGIPFVRDFVIGRRAPYDNLIALTDYFGQVVLVRDNGASAEWLWVRALDATGTVKATTSPVLDDVNGYVNVGASDGRLYQITVKKGAIGATRTEDSGGEDVVALLSQWSVPDADGQRALSLTAASETSVVARYCAPFASPRGKKR